MRRRSTNRLRKDLQTSPTKLLLTSPGERYIIQHDILRTFLSPHWISFSSPHILFSFLFPFRNVKYWENIEARNIFSTLHIEFDVSWNSIQHIALKIYLNSALFFISSRFELQAHEAKQKEGWRESDLCLKEK